MTTLRSKWVKEVLETDDAPAAIGPYSQANAAGPLIFVSGQLGLVPGTKKFAGPDVQEQTTQAMENLAAVLDKGESSLDMVLKITVYLSDMDDFSRFNKVYETYFGPDPPARAAVEVARLPLDAKVEIEAVALRY